ncbi:CocE/NonD family hydrolase [Caballeronia sp. SEWSISQ10-4 2]|nr:CocE/NonD family hydrolase [Caballeronia sp. SEWSISQ10-4 2]MDN7180306.1 CocE/NonD family hydrolase [Caballeronia sp. SEWSISQ10-4 2]
MIHKDNLDAATGQGATCTEFMIPMRDGVRLATDVHLPAGFRPGIDAPLPTILERTPYGKREVSRSEINRGKPAARRGDIAAYFVARGFAVVFQDCRGRHASEGEFTKYLSEGPDGYDTLEWITQQDWSTGRVGTMGLSYAAHTQMAAACMNPPGLVCMVIDSGGFANSYQCGIRQGGAFELKQATWAVNQAKGSQTVLNDPLLKAALDAQDLKEWFSRMPWRPGQSPLRFVPEYERYLFDQWTHETFDEFWQQPGIYAEGFYDTMARVPTVLMSSWYDAYVRSTMDNFAALSKLDPVAAPTYLIMGSWLHGDRNVPFSGDVDFGPAAMIEGQIAEDWLAFRAQWFVRWLKPATSEVTRPDPVARIFLMGGGSGARNAEGRMQHGGAWIESSQWPLADTRFTCFYLREGGVLSEQPPAEADASVSYAFDPSNPVPTIGGALTSGAPVFEGGAFDQREDERFFGTRNPGVPLAARNDIVVFETPPLEEDMAVVGPVIVRLWISSDAPDTDFTAKLIDMCPPNSDYPEGFAMNLTDGIFRCRFHKSWSEPEFLESGRICEIKIEPFATANLFKRGHRIRLDISSSNFPHFDVNPNSGESPALARAPRIAVNTVYLGTDNPSHLVLPIVPVNALRGLEALAGH